ncbi:MAG: DUF488 family protein [Dokdonella sp.]
MNRSIQSHIAIQRAYDEPTAHDGYRVLVDRFWPRGGNKQVPKLEQWARELAPSAALVRWFHAAPERWDDFRPGYREELATPAQVERLQTLLVAASTHRITLVDGASNTTQNQAVVLRDVLLAMQLERKSR